MALIWIDGFEGYGTSGSVANASLQYRYPDSSASNLYIAAGRVSGYCWNSAYINWSFITPALTIDPTLIVGCAFYFLQTYAFGAISFVDNATAGINVTFNPTVPSTVVLKRGSTTLSTTTLASTLLTNTWYYVEVKSFCHDTSGAVEVRINGATVVSISGIDTKNGADAFCDRVRIYLEYGYIDDYYICDGTGTSLNNFQGVCNVVGIFPKADTATVQWAPSTGSTHYNLVDENPPNAATDYVSTSTQANTDLYEYPTLVGSGTILGLQVNSTVALSAGVSIVFEAPIVSNGVTELGPDTVLSSSSYGDVRHISTIDPNTGQPWTIAGLGSALIGVRVM